MTLPPPENPSPTGPGPIVLTGFMGTGKTTVGRLVAERLGFAFVDTDQLIEQRHGAIATIFAEQGEQAFRQLEQEVARELADRRRIVIATGGRLMLDPANAAALSCHGTVFALTAPVDQIITRVLADGSGVERPLLAGPDPAARVAALLDERRAGYGRFAQIDTAGRSPDEVADELVAIVGSLPT